RIQGRGARAARLELLGGRDPAAGEIGVPLGDDLRVGRLRDVALQVGLRRQQRGFERTAVQRKEQLALRDVVAFLEIDRRQLSRDLRVDGYDGIRFDR